MHVWTRPTTGWQPLPRALWLPAWCTSSRRPRQRRLDRRRSAGCAAWLARRTAAGRRRLRRRRGHARRCATAVGDARPAAAVPRRAGAGRTGAAHAAVAPGPHRRPAAAADAGRRPSSRWPREFARRLAARAGADWDDDAGAAAGAGRPGARCAGTSCAASCARASGRRARQRSASGWRSCPALVALIRRLGRARARRARRRRLPPQPPTPAPRRAAARQCRDAPARRAGRDHAASASPAASNACWPARPRCCAPGAAQAVARAPGRGAAAHLRQRGRAASTGGPTPRRRRAQRPAPPRPRRWSAGRSSLCLDTSGSMRGAPENIAKAVVLAGPAHRPRERPRLPADRLRRARRADRARARTRGAAGLQPLLDLMGQGFDGGTDVQAPIERAVERVHEARWAGADLLIVSDGEFGCMPATLARLDEARDASACACRACWSATARRWACWRSADDIHWVRDWRRHGRRARSARCTSASRRCTAGA